MLNIVTNSVKFTTEGGKVNLIVDINAAEVFSITRPFNITPLDPAKFLKKIISLKSSTTQLSFKGEVIKLSVSGIYFFAINPIIENVEMLTSYDLSYSDFATHSPLFDSFILIQSERFATKEKMKAIETLENYNIYAKLNLDIANFCSRCTEIKDAIDYSISCIENFVGWKGYFESSIDPNELFTQELLIDEKYISIPLSVNEKLRFRINFIQNNNDQLPEYLKIFLKSLRFTLENFITRIDQHMAIQEIQANEVTASKMYALGEMAAGIAHELNNPLTVVKGIAYLTLTKLTQEEVPDLSLIDRMDKIIKMVDRSAKIIHGLKVFAREASEDPMIKIDLVEIIEDTLELCKSRIESKKIKLEWFPIESGFSLGRATQISQVILNLINNAYDAIENDNNPWIKVNIDLSGDYWQISVLDSGPGIPKNIRDKIMSPFFTTKPPGKGTGLGLSICNSILKQHNGILLYDDQKSSTCFSFKLPLFIDKTSRSNY